MRLNNRFVNSIMSVVFAVSLVPFQGKASQPVTPGGAITGGGEPESQELRGVIAFLPNLLKAKGLQYFPEINMEAFEARVNSKIKIEIKSDLKVDGAPKATLFDRVKNLIYIDPVKWLELGPLGQITPAKQALAFHEVLGLMFLEKNNEYHISNRLLDLPSLTLNGLRGASNQILPYYNNDPQVIYWQVSPEGLYSFYYCTDRNNNKSCSILGNRGYQKSELTTLMKSYNQRLDRDLARAHRIWKAYKIIHAVYYGVVAVLFLVGVLAFPASALAWWMVSLGAVGGVATLSTIDPALNTVSTNERDSVRWKEIASTAELKSKRSERNLKDYAQDLHNFLIEIPGLEAPQKSMP